MTAFRFFSVDGDKGNVLPFHIFFRVRVILFICVYRIWLQNDARKSRKLSECDQMVDGGVEMEMGGRRVMSVRSDHWKFRIRKCQLIEIESINRR